MKPFIFTTLLLCTSFLCLSQTSTTQVQTSFNGFHCDGKPGFCSIDNQENRSVTNTSLQLNNNNTLTFIVERQQLTKSEFENITSTKKEDYNPSKTYYLEVPEAFYIQESIYTLLQTESTPLVISKGRYPIQISEKELIIIFNLQ